MVLPKFDLTGKTALITGAAGMLGMEHAAALLESGATVLLTDISQTDLKAASNLLSKHHETSRVLTSVMNVTDPADIKATADMVAGLHLRVDILVNNAAIDPKVIGHKGLVETSRMENFPSEQWDLQVDVGLKGAFLCSQVFGTAMSRDGQGGVILNIASDLSVIAPDQRLYRKKGLPDELQSVKPVTYSVIKAGLIGLTRYLATYWAEQGVRCNALSPGGVFNGQSENFVKSISHLIPLGHMAPKDCYRSALQFLCSDASSYMTGQNIVIDGGRSVW